MFDKNRAMLFFMLDLSNAFETTDHEQLQTLLHDEYGVLEKVLSGFRTYLEFCAQSVQIDYNIPDYSATKWCATELGPCASYVHTIHHSNAADI